MKYFYTLLSILSFLPALAITPQEEFYLRQYPAPTSVKLALRVAGWFGYKLDQALDNNLVAYDNVNAFTVPFLPNYIIKPQVDRIRGAELINAAIAAQSRPLFFVPKKYAYADNKTWLLAEKVKLVNKPFTKDHIEQLCTIAKITKFIDLHDGNIGQTASGQGVILDTGREGFADRKFDLINGYNKIKDTLPMDQEARNYLDNVIKDRVARNEITKWYQEKIQEERLQKYLQQQKSREEKQYRNNYLFRAW